MCDALYKHKILKQFTKMFLDACVEFLQQLELIDKFNTSKSKAEAEAYIIMIYFVQCKYCNKKHEQDKKKIVNL